MNVKEFAQEVIEKLKEKLGSTADVMYVEKDSTNGIILHGMVIKPKESNIAPTIYVDQMLEFDFTVEQTAEKIYEIYQKHKIEEMDLNYILDFEGFVKDHLRARLYNESTKAEVFRSAKQYGLDGLIVVPYVDIDFNEQNCSIKVMEKYLKQWDISADEPIDIAIGNSAKVSRIQTMAEIFSERTGMPIEMLPDELDVMKIINVTENYGMYGAISAVTIQSQLKELYPDGYYIIPCSIHECIIVDASLVEKGMDIDEMIKLVNNEALEPCDVLGDHAYKMGGVA